MQKPEGRPITNKEAEIMIDRYQSGKVPFRPGKEKGCVNAVAFNKKIFKDFLDSDDNTEIRVVMAAHGNGVPTVVIQTYSLDNIEITESSVIGNQVNSFEDGLTCPPFPEEVCNPG